MLELPGRAASEGLALGPVVRVEPLHVPDDLVTDLAFDEVARRTADRLDGLAATVRDEGRVEEADVLEAYALIATDPALARDVSAGIAGGGTLVRAVRAAVERMAGAFAAMADEYFAQRADDVRGVGRELLATIVGRTAAAPVLPVGGVVCADDLTPADTVRLDLSRVAGFATERGGPTSHTAIVARAAGIPAVVGADGLMAAVTGGTTVLVDGDAGRVVVEPDDDERTRAAARIDGHRRRAVEHRRLRGTLTTFDGHRILVAANVGTLDGVAAAADARADGIGLFRSEFLFLERSDAPDLAEQREAYRAAVAAFADPTVVRTLDIGGDKEVAYLALPPEANPFLGVRGLRLTLANPELFDVQLDALLHVEELERLRVMFPMVATTSELAAGTARLAQRAVLLGRTPPAAGVMIETPSAALLAPHLARHAAFFSIGTNDLTQYVTASDRTHGALGALQDAANPAVLQLVARAAEAGRAAGIPTAVCGEAAGDPATLALFLGYGVEELSVTASRIDLVRWTVAQLDPVAVRAAALRALTLPDADAVRELVAPLLP
jgi:phosphoenolpyruvate-protein phosphotransferase